MEHYIIFALNEKIFGKLSISPNQEFSPYFNYLFQTSPTPLKPSEIYIAESSPLEKAILQHKSPKTKKSQALLNLDRFILDSREESFLTQIKRYEMNKEKTIYLPKLSYSHIGISSEGFLFIEEKKEEKEMIGSFSYC